MPTDADTQRLHIADVVARFGSSIGLPEANLDDGDRLDLEIGEAHVTLMIQGKDAPLLWIGCGLGEFPVDNPGAAEWLLSEAFDHWAYLETAIAVDPEHGRAQMHTAVVPEELSVEELEQRLSSLLDVAKPLKEGIERFDFVGNSAASFGLDDGMIII